MHAHSISNMLHNTVLHNICVCITQCYNILYYVGFLENES